MRTIPASELIINDDGSIFHLHLHPGQLADTVILVGDPGRVALVAGFFELGKKGNIRGNMTGCSATGKYDFFTHDGISSKLLSVVKITAPARFLPARGRADQDMTWA